jgi:exodeoxyribonuclease VIII
MYLRGEVDYDAIDAVNFSTLKYAAKSPLAYFHRLNNPKASTIPQLRGTASHTAILEPERLESDYAIFTGKVRNGKVWDAFEAENAHRKIIKQGELDQALRMQRAVRSMPCADAYLSDGHAEVTLVWMDDVTGLLCKGRVDYVKGDDAIVDLKGTGDASGVSFAREAGRQKYHVQASFYLDGYTTLFPMAHPESVLIAVEYSEPHDVAPYVIDADSLEAGRRIYRACLDRIAQCRAERRWPGVANGSVQTLRLPAYELMEEDGDVELTVDGESIAF